MLSCHLEDHCTFTSYLKRQAHIKAVCSSILSFGGSSKCAPRKNGDFLVLFCSPKWLNIETWLGLRCMGSSLQAPLANRLDGLRVQYLLQAQCSCLSSHTKHSIGALYAGLPPYFIHGPSAHSFISSLCASSQPLAANGALTSMPVESSDRAPRHCMTHSMYVWNM